MPVIAQGERLAQIVRKRMKAREMVDPGRFSKTAEADFLGPALVAVAQEMGGKGGRLDPVEKGRALG